MNYLKCSHHKLVEIDDKLYCDSCGLEFEPSAALCSCSLVEQEGENICVKCGAAYDEQGLRKTDETI